MEEEREYTFTTSRGTGTEETYTLKESELDEKHLGMLEGEIIMLFKNAPTEVKKHIHAFTATWNELINIRIGGK
jgi:hypothetical protein